MSKAVVEIGSRQSGTDPVSLIQQALACARENAVVAVAIVLVSEDGEPFHVWHGGRRLVGEIEMLKAELVASLCVAE